MAPPRMLDDQIRYNKRRSVLIVAYVFVVLALLIGFVSFILGVPWWLGLVFGGLGALLYVMIASGFSVQAVLRAADARPADPKVREEKLLIYKVEQLAIAAGIPAPKVYVTPSKDLNAFATGRNPKEAVVAVTKGGLKEWSQEELEGVLAHELSHVKNYDIRLATITIAMVAIIAITAEIVFRIMFFGGVRGGGRGGKEGGMLVLVLIVVGVLFVILAPILSRLAYLALTRQREYLADSTGAMMTRNPHGLASALEKIQADIIDDPKGSRTVASLFIANPFKRQFRESLWATHPPLDKRIARLRGVDLETYRKMRAAGAN